MSVSTIGSNSNTIADLLDQRRRTLASQEAAVQSGHLEAAQQTLTSVQSDPSSIQSASGSNASSSPAVNPYRSSLATDLTSLSSALQSVGTGQTPAAPAIVQSDPTTASSTVQGTGAAHHGHHHHGGGGGESTSSSQQIAASLFGSGTSSTDVTSTSGTSTSGTSTSGTSTNGTSTSDPFASTASSGSGDVLSQLLASLDATQPGST